MSTLNTQNEANALIAVATNCAPREATSIADTLVREGYAACVNMMPGVRSCYIWDGDFVEENETSLLIKTTEAAVQPLVERLRELHSYTNPEILVLKPAAVSETYLAWAQEQTRRQAR